MFPTMQPARPELANYEDPPSMQSGVQVKHRAPVSMSVHAGRPASTGSDLKPTANPDSPINNARFCRRTGAPEMMQTKQKTPAEIAADKNSDVLSVLQKAKKALTPTEIAHAIQASKGSECWCMRKYPGMPPMADTSLVGAVLRRIKAVKVGRGLYLKPGAKVKG